MNSIVNHFPRHVKPGPGRSKPDKKPGLFQFMRIRNKPGEGPLILPFILSFILPWPGA